jgi:hypothetical protein
VKRSRFSLAGRLAALAALSALALVFLGPSIGLADAAAGGERCVGCPGCESGDCGARDENPLESHHHCCTTCCMSHVPFALPTPLSFPGSAVVDALPTCTSPAMIGRTHDTPYRPPRV